jgi:hypothetical protein
MNDYTQDTIQLSFHRAPFTLGHVIDTTCYEVNKNAKNKAIAVIVLSSFKH